MTEAEWLAGTDPVPMLDHLGANASERKLRLFACAWAYDLWPLLTNARSRNAVVVAERFADGLAGSGELRAAFKAAQQAWRAIPQVRGGRHGSGAAKEAAAVAWNAANPVLSVTLGRLHPWRHNSGRRYALANHLRDLFGNPFRPPPCLASEVLRWNGGTVLKLAAAIDDEHRFADMPILADALEEAGCDNVDIISHCRSDRPHIRGCWVVDAILAETV